MSFWTKSVHLFWEVRGSWPCYGHVPLHGDGGHGEHRRHDGHVGHEVGHLTEDYSEYPVSGNMIKTLLGNDKNRGRESIIGEWMVLCVVNQDCALTYSSWRQSWMYCWRLCLSNLPHRGWRWTDLWPSAFFCSLTNNEISNVAAMENMKITYETQSKGRYSSRT